MDHPPRTILSKIKAKRRSRTNVALMTQDLSYAMRNVPRYTSYPTAPHFHEGVDSDTYRTWLRSIGPEDSLSLYLHVPYCREICHYCGCHTKASKQDGPLEAYGKTLLREIELAALELTEAGPVRHIHWGGGTPSLLPRENLVELSALMHSLFEMHPDIEHAIELDPRLVTKDLAETLAMIGINRTSLGVQDFDPQVQKAIGRVQRFETVVRANDHLRAAGLNACNFDLMYGLPHQTRATILDTVEKTVSLRPGRIALFGYAHVPWMRKHQRLIDESLLPSPAERLDLAESARAALLEAGYVPIGLDHFALADDTMAVALADGSLKRNFQGYTTDQGEQLIGFGVSSIGKLAEGFIQNMSDVGNWRRAVDSGKLPVARGLALSTQDRLRGRIIEQLMTGYSCDLGAACSDFGVAAQELSPSIDALSELASDGLVQVRRAANDADIKIEVTDAGRPYVRLAAAAFDTYLESGQARHSMAV